ncbi:dixin-like isoform X3 [Tachypleus tridentatus]|uniref:dixin-like isoform X3 n=1 Tax=Tachypleus tridentatus TaxID=6853 RepID=UPI003FD092D2
MCFILRPENLNTFLRSTLSQLRAYTAWINVQLKKRSHSRLVNDLRTDLQDGVTLANLVESLGGESIAGINKMPTSVAASRENVHRILQYLVTKQVNMPVTNVKDIVEGDLKSIMKLVHAIASHYKPASTQTPSSLRNAPSTSQRTRDTEFLYSSTDGNKDTIKLGIVIEGTQQPTTFKIAVPSSEKNSKTMNSAGSTSEENRWLCATLQERKDLVPEKPNYINGFGRKLQRHSILDTERLVNGGGEVDGASSNGSPTPTETSWPQSAGDDLSLKSFVFQHTSLPRQEKQLQYYSTSSKEILLSQADLRYEESTEIFPSHVGHHLVNIRQLSEDVRKSKQQLLVLREVLLRGQHHGQDSNPIRPELKPTPEKNTCVVPIETHSSYRNDAFDADTEHVEEKLEDMKINLWHLHQKKEDLERQLREKEIENRHLREELQQQDKMLSQERLKYEETIRGFTSANRSKQSYELRVVRDALLCLRDCFESNDPYQHTLDTIEQSITSLLERVNALEIARSKGFYGEGLTSSSVRNLNYDSTGDPRRYPITTLPDFPLHRLDSSTSRITKDSYTKVLYYTDKSVTPFLSVIPKSIGEITLRDFKELFDRSGHYRYHFKTLDAEFGTVKEEAEKVTRWDSSKSSTSKIRGFDSPRWTQQIA